MGISDVSPSANMKKMKFDILSAGYKKVCDVLPHKLMSRHNHLPPYFFHETRLKMLLENTNKAR
jgi:hypothetical protein